uniref:Uncharacterized protein n=1 Tax=Arundo donax TaxID=35708 RepID=A0A0A9APF7_ARUDO
MAMSDWVVSSRRYQQGTSPICTILLPSLHIQRWSLIDVLSEEPCLSL